MLTCRCTIDALNDVHSCDCREYNRKLAEFNLFDVDHDGNLTEAELQAGLRAQQKSEREIKQMWERLELNELGGVGPREYALMSIAV